MMDINQLIVFLTLALSLVFFVWGRWRYDIVAIMALLVVAVTGIVPANDAFTGFGHPAVVTVAAVLIISRGLINSGVIDALTNQLFKLKQNMTVQILVIVTIVAALSSMMNNVGAIAIMLPVTVQIAHKNRLPPSLFLMPIAFGSLLGGLTTMIGTPPNIIIALVRQQEGMAGFRMFDFFPVGGAVTLAGILFISLIGWRLLPKRKGQASLEELFHIQDYISEVRVVKNSSIAGSRIWELAKLKDLEINIIGIARDKRRIVQPASTEVLLEDDVLVIEADSGDLKAFVDKAKLELAGDREIEKDILGSEEIIMAEAVVMLDSILSGKTALSLNLRRRYGLNLLAVARKGLRINQRIASIRFQPGDVLLLNGPASSINETIVEMGCIPLAQRNLKIGKPKQIIKSLTIFVAAILIATFNILPIQISLTIAAVAMVLTRLISIREVYENIDWSVIILLGAMIPVGMAFETSGGAQPVYRHGYHFC
jgi:di/tricarboxylate transporter